MKRMISQVKHYMEHNDFLRKLVPIARRLGIIHFLHWIAECMEGSKGPGEKEQEAKAFFASHEEEFQRLEGMLEDQLSKDTLRSIMTYRQTGEMSALKGMIRQPQYFQKDIFGPVPNEVFVDGGAYTGDTVESYLKNFVGGGYLQKDICLGT